MLLLLSVATELPNRERGLTVASKLFGLVDGSDEPDKAEISEPAAATESGAGGELPAENAEHRNSAGDGSLSVKKMSIGKKMNSGER